MDVKADLDPVLPKPLARCGFCLKTEEEVMVLIAGEKCTHTAYMCDECVVASNKVVVDYLRSELEKNVKKLEQIMKLGEKT